MNKCISIFLLISAGLLTACSSKPSHIIVAPQLLNKPVQVYQNQAISLNVSDLRNNNHLVQILRKNEAAELVNSHQSLDSALKHALVQGWQQQKLSIDSVANISATANIDQALISVQQDLVEYTANTHIQVRIVLHKGISDGDSSLEKTFSLKASSSGPFNADLAVLERDFNQQLTKLLTQIFSDSEIQQFIKH